MRLDLHLHSQASDGSELPSALVDAAAAARLDVIALTDHDTTSGLEAARHAARLHPIEVIAGIELSSIHAGESVHILGYFVDPCAPRLRAYEVRAAHRREERMREMIRRLGRQGIPVTWEAVAEIAGPSRQSVGRPHLARALVRAGHAENVPDAFDRFIGNRHPAYVPTALLSAPEAVRLVSAVGGIPVWAHPRFETLKGFLPDLKAAGLRGIEVYRPRTPPNRIPALEETARAWNLMVTGGSDWHGPGSGRLGEFYVSSEEVAELLHAGAM